MSAQSRKQKKPRSAKIYTPKTIDTRNHSFNVGIATDYSTDMALWIGYLGFWTERNLANEKHIYDGLVWCYDTLEALGEHFIYYSKRQLETIINNSVKEGLVQKGNYNHTQYDRTCWYALTPKAYFYFAHLVNEKYLKRLYDSISQNCEMDYTEMRNRFPRSVTPIPYTDPFTDPKETTTTEEPSNQESKSSSSFSENDKKHDDKDNQTLEEMDVKKDIENTDDSLKSDYRNNQT